MTQRQLELADLRARIKQLEEKSAEEPVKLNAQEAKLTAAQTADREKLRKLVDEAEDEFRLVDAILMLKRLEKVCVCVPAG